MFFCGLGSGCPTTNLCRMSEFSRTKNKYKRSLAWFLSPGLMKHCWAMALCYTNLHFLQIFNGWFWKRRKILFIIIFFFLIKKLTSIRCCKSYTSVQRLHALFHVFSNSIRVCPDWEVFPAKREREATKDPGANTGKTGQLARWARRARRVHLGTLGARVVLVSR